MDIDTTLGLWFVAEIVSGIDIWEKCLFRILSMAAVLYHSYSRYFCYASPSPGSLSKVILVVVDMYALAVSQIALATKCDL